PRTSPSSPSGCRTPTTRSSRPSGPRRRPWSGCRRPASRPAAARGGGGPRGGADARADTGESAPAVALQDALATFPADRIVVFSHPAGDRDYREDEGLADAEQRSGIPVTHALISR